MMLQCELQKHQQFYISSESNTINDQHWSRRDFGIHIFLDTFVITKVIDHLNNELTMLLS